MDRGGWCRGSWAYFAQRPFMVLMNAERSETWGLFRLNCTRTLERFMILFENDTEEAGRHPELPG